MPEAEGFADEDVAVAEVRVVVQVAAAEAGGGDVDLDFVVGGWGDGAAFLCSVLVCVLFTCADRWGGSIERTTRRSLAA